jgi:hypothetical protein
MLTHEQKAKWLARLREPGMVQAYGHFYDWSNDCYCAMGHLCAAHGYMRARVYYEGWHLIAEISEIQHEAIMHKNDKLRQTLPEIADWIEENVPCSL